MTIEQLHPDELVELSFHARDPEHRARAQRLLERQGAARVDGDGRPIPGYRPNHGESLARRLSAPGYYAFVDSLM